MRNSKIFGRKDLNSDLGQWLFFLIGESANIFRAYWRENAVFRIGTLILNIHSTTDWPPLWSSLRQLRSSEISR